MTRALRRSALSLFLSTSHRWSPTRWLALAATLGPSAVALASPPRGAAVPSLSSLTLPDGRGALRIEQDGGLRLGEARLGPLLEPGQHPSAATLTLFVEGPGSWLIEARLRIGAGGQAAMLRLRVGQPLELLFVEPYGPTSDGELQRQVTIDARGAQRWQGTPAVARCDGAQPLFLERYDATARRWSSAPAQVPVAPTQGVSPALLLPPPRRALRFSSASTDGVSDRADRLGAPRELDDGKDATALALGQGAAARGAFVTARAPRAVELIAIRVAPPPAPARLPEALVLLGGSPVRAVARLSLAGANGARWFALSPHLSGNCVSLVVDEQSSSNAAIGLGEVTLYAADDAPDGLAELARQVGSDAVDAEGAARSLETQPGGGAAALEALAAATPTGRRRLLAIVRTQGAELRPADAPRLVRELALARGEERALLIDLVAALGETGLPELTHLLADATQTDGFKKDAMTVLARLAARSATAQTLVFDALRDAGLRDAARDDLSVAAGHEPSLGLVAAKRLALIPAAEGSTSARAPEMAALVAVMGAAVPRTTEASSRAALFDALDRLGPLPPLPFELAVRVLSTRSRLGGPSLYSTASAVLRQSGDAALRLVALDALPPATEPAARLLFTSALTDEDARVRELALRRLVAAPGSATTEQLSARADDRWPQIRRLAYEALGDRCATTSSVATLLDHRVFGKGRVPAQAAEVEPRARALALSALARCPGVSAEVIAAAIDPKQPGEVREQAALLLSRGGAAVLPILSRSLDKVFQRGGAELPGTAVALLRALGRVGEGRGEAPFDDATLVLLRDSAADPFHPAIRIAAIEALSRGCPTGARVVFDRSEKDPEPAVQRAAALGRTRCPR